MIDKAADLARRYGHAVLTGDHPFVALAYVEWDLFVEKIKLPISQQWHAAAHVHVRAAGADVVVESVQPGGSLLCGV